MKTYKTKAFTLSSHAFGESHKIVSILSQELGRCDVLAYDIRKTKNRYGARLEFLSEVFLVLSPSASEHLYYIKDVELLNTYQHLKSNLEYLGYMYYLVSFLFALIPKGSFDVAVYKDLYALLENASKYPHAMYVLVRTFELRTLKELGFLADLGYCSHSHASIDPHKEELAVCDAPGWIIKQEYSHLYRQSRTLSTGCYKILAQLVEKPEEYLLRLRIHAEMRKELNVAFEFLLRSVVGKSLRFRIDLPYFR